MSLDSLLAFVGILIAIYALAGPIQRRSMGMFISRWVLFVPFGASFVLVMVPDVADAWGCSISPWSELGVQTGSFILPMIGVLAAWLQWREKKLTNGNAKQLPELLSVSLRENHFDEAKQIVQNNEAGLAAFPEVLDVFYDRRMVRALLESRSYLHLRLLANKNLFQKMSDPFRAVDAVAREMICADTSPLRSAVVAAYGGEERPSYPADQRQLVKTTLQDPEWFTLTSAHYPLLMVAMEELRSGRRDEAYNQIGRAYEARQGLAARSHCPIYLYLKTHVLAINNAIEQCLDENEDLYVDDPQQLFRAILQRSRYNPGVWDSDLAYWEHPTPYSYLLYEINYDYRHLCETAYRQAVGVEDSEAARKPGRRVKKIAESWATCVWDIAGADKHVSPAFQQRIVQSYLNFVLQVRYAPSEFVIPDLLHATEGLPSWWEVFVQALKRPSWDLYDKVSILIHAVDSLDVGKSYVSDGQEQLRQDLGLGEV